MLKLQAVELSKSYKGRKVVDDVEVEIGQGEVVGLLGPNGAGKTTTFYILVGLARPDSGRVLLNGDEITDLPMYLRARNGISYLPQEPSVFRQLTSEQNLLAVLETLPLTPEQQRDRLEELLVQMGLRACAKTKPIRPWKKTAADWNPPAGSPNSRPSPCGTSRFPGSIR